MSGFCEHCNYFIPFCNDTGRGRCLQLESCAISGVIRKGKTMDCEVRVSRHQSDEACEDWKSALPDEIMQDIIDREHEEAKWL